MSNLKKLNTQAEYEAFKAGDLFVLPNVSLIEDGMIVIYNKKNGIPYNQIMYTSSTNSVVTPYKIDFGANIISNIYEDGVGIITFDTDVTTIGLKAFYQRSSLTSITIPNSVTSIGNGAFYKCSGLTSITIPNSVTNINNSAFYRCSGLTSVIIPNSVTSIGDSTFYGCDGLTSVEIGNSVTSIDDLAFTYCSVLASVTMSSIIPPSLVSSAFEHTSSDLIIYVPDESVDTYKAATNWNSYADKIKPMSLKPA